MQQGFSRIERIFDASTNDDSSRTWRGFVHVSLSVRTCCERCALRDQGVQQPVYYISKTLVDAVMRYLPLEKLELALVHATRKLPHYFQNHTVYVLTEYSL